MAKSTIAQYFGNKITHGVITDVVKYEYLSDGFVKAFVEGKKFRAEFDWIAALREAGWHERALLPPKFELRRYHKVPLAVPGLDAPGRYDWEEFFPSRVAVMVFGGTYGITARRMVWWPEKLVVLVENRWFYASSAYITSLLESGWKLTKSSNDFVITRERLTPVVISHYIEEPDPDVPALYIQERPM